MDDVAIVFVDGPRRCIYFYVSDEALADIERYGFVRSEVGAPGWHADVYPEELVKRGLMSIIVDTRYNLRETLKYMVNYGKE